MSGARQPVVMIFWALALAAAGGLGAPALPDLGLPARDLPARGRPDRAGPPVTHTVTIDASSFRPARLAVRAGDTVVWVNEDLIPHTATAKGGGFDSKAVAAGASWRWTVKGPGATDYTCAFHPTMTGRIDAD